MSLLDAVWLILLGAIICINLYIAAMILGALAEWLVLKVKDRAAHR